MVAFFFNDTATTEIYTLSLHDALPIWGEECGGEESESGERSAVERSAGERSVVEGSVVERREGRGGRRVRVGRGVRWRTNSIASCYQADKCLAIC